MMIAEIYAEIAASAIMKFRAKVGGRYYPGYHEDMRDAVRAAILESDHHASDLAVNVVSQAVTDDPFEGSWTERLDHVLGKIRGELAFGGEVEREREVMTNIKIWNVGDRVVYGKLHGIITSFPKRYNADLAKVKFDKYGAEKTMSLSLLVRPLNDQEDGR